MEELVGDNVQAGHHHLKWFHQRFTRKLHIEAKSCGKNDEKCPPIYIFTYVISVKLAMHQSFTAGYMRNNIYCYELLMGALTNVNNYTHINESNAHQILNKKIIDDYNHCNRQIPNTRLRLSIWFPHTGPYYFLSLSISNMLRNRDTPYLTHIIL